MPGSLTIPRILWAGLFVSTFMYLAPLELMEPGASGWKPLLVPLVFAAVTMAGLSLVAPRLLLRQRSSPGMPARTPPQRAYLFSLLVSMSFAESVAIFGLILGLLGAPEMTVLPFFAASWVLMLIRFPTLEKLGEFSA